MREVMQSPVWAMALARHLAETGVDPAPTMRAAGLPERATLTPDTHVAFAPIVAFFEIAAEATDNPLLGFEFGQTVDVRDAGLAAFISVYAETVAEAVDHSVRYIRLNGDAVEIDLSGWHDANRIAFDHNVPPSVSHRQYTEFFATGLVNAYRQMVNAGFSFERVRFRHPRRQGVEAMRRYYRCDMAFGAPENAFYYHPGDINRLMRLRDHRLVAYLRGPAEALLAERHTNVPKLQAEIERAILVHLASASVTKAQVARHLGLSERSLARRLQEDGLTFRGLVAGLREALATRYLTQSDLPLAQIAFQLGFADQASFSTAYKRWTGVTPTEMRRRSL